MRISKRGGINEGRPMKYETKESLEKAIKDYFEDIEARDQSPTMTGLALALDLSRQGLVNYANNEKYFDTIKRAKQKVEAYNEQKLISGTPATGLIFNLKNNFGWKDTTEQSITTNQKIVYVEKEEKESYEKHIEEELNEM
jgi:hypothetical protein